MFRRPFSRPFRRGMANAIPPLLRRANELMASGQFAQAAQAYEQLAHAAQARALPRAAQLFLQAGRCHLMAGQAPAAMPDLNQGLTLLARQGDQTRLYRVGQRTLAELGQRGLTAEVAAVQSLLASLLPDGFAAAPIPAASASTPRLLPTACPTCGAPLRSDEVEWADEYTAECPFCGGAVRAA